MVRIESAFRPNGEPREMTSHKPWSISPAWMPNGRSILYLFGTTPTPLATELRMVDLSSGRPQRETILATKFTS
jgi:hypothetical protein